jgi:hypothetical protein
VTTATIFVLGSAVTALGAIQSKPFDSTTTPQEVVDTYKSGLPFKQYISLTIKNPAGTQIAKQELGNANIDPPSQAGTTSLNCARYISFILEDR